MKCQHKSVWHHCLLGRHLDNLKINTCGNGNDTHVVYRIGQVVIWMYILNFIHYGTTYTGTQNGILVIEVSAIQRFVKRDFTVHGMYVFSIFSIFIIIYNNTHHIAEKFRRQKFLQISQRNWYSQKFYS